MKKVLVITGGSRGIGEAAITRFMKDNWQVINLSRTPSTIANVTNLNADLQKPETLQQHATQLAKLLESATHVTVVHNAAFYERDSVDSLKVSNLQKTLAVSIISPVTLNQLLLPYLPAGSCIIYIGTTLARKAVPGSASYTTAKHAVVGLMKATCQDLAPKNIRACMVNPGLVDTVLLKDTMDAATQTFLLENIVLGRRLIEPIEIADVIYFCATTPCINGAVIDADLGQAAD